MSQLLETLGRGLLGRLFDVFEKQLPGSIDDDLDQLVELARGASTSADLALQVGKAHLREARLANARAAFERARELGAPTGVAERGLACVLDDLGRYSEAVELLKQVQSAHPKDAAVAFALGLLHEREDDVDEARLCYEAATANCPQLRNAHERLAALDVREQNWSSAAARYEQLSDIAPEDLDLLLTLATLRFQEGELERSVEGFQRVLLVEPDTCDTVNDASLNDESKLVESIAALEKLVQRYPGVGEFRVHLADMYAKAADDENAVQHYRAALELNPSYLEATIKLGTQHLRRSRFDAAARQFNRAMELNDRLLSAFIGLGVAQHANGATNEALATFDLAANLAPNSVLLYGETNRLQLRVESSTRRRDGKRVATLDEDNFVDEVMRRHERAVRSNPSWADAHYRHGLMLRSADRLNEAIRAFRDATTLSPNFSRAHEKLGVCLHEVGAHDQALEAFRDSLRVAPEAVEMHYQLALLYSQQNQFELSVERFLYALDGAIKEDDVQHTLHLSLQNMGLVDRSNAMWRSICEMAPLPEWVERRLMPLPLSEN